jgi:hypothetical protein
MKRYLLTLVLLIWMTAACAPQPKPTEPPPLPNDDSSSTPTKLTPAQNAAVSALSTTLNLPPGQITVISAQAVDWPDGCLGIQKIGVMCTQAIVPGYRIILEANGAQYEVHTNKDGSQIAQAGRIKAAGTVTEIVIKQLTSNLGLKESDVSVVSTAEIDFADSCLGVAMNNVACAQLVTPGQIVVLEAKGIQYEYHVTSDGSQIQPATLALTWTREGGFAGFCDSMTVFLSGEVYGNQCKSQSNGTMGTFAHLLSASERQQFNAWFKELGQVSLDASDPKGVSDRMVVTLEFYGNGKGTLGKSDQQELLLWAQSLFQKLFS